MKKLALALMLTGVSACTLYPDNSSVLAPPSRTPVRSFTGYTNALHCMNKLVRATGKKTDHHYCRQYPG